MRHRRITILLALLAMSVLCLYGSVMSLHDLYNDLYQIAAGSLFVKLIGIQTAAVTSFLARRGQA
jgi:hypothetical protein